MKGLATAVACAAAALATAAAASAPAAAIGPGEAASIAIETLADGPRTERPIVFRAPRPVAAGAAIHEARLNGDGALDPTATARGRMPVALRAPRGERAWLFYEDRAPYALFEHGGRVVLVGKHSGMARVSDVLAGPPIVGGQLPRFLRSFAGYRASADRVIWPAARPAGAGDAVASTTLLATAAQSPLGAEAARRRAATALAADRLCHVRVSDTLGNFFDYAAVDRSRAAFGGLFNRLHAIAPGVVSRRYWRRTGLTVSEYVQQLIDARGCRELSLYLAGGGFRAGGQSVVAVGVRPAGGGRIQRQLLRAGDLRALLRSRPGVQWNLTVDAPAAGGILAALRGEPNLASAQTSGRTGDMSYAATAQRGRLGAGRLEFTGGLLAGLNATLADGRAIDAAVAARGAGRAPSFLAALLDRAFDAGIGPRPFAQLGVQPQSYVRSAAGGTQPGGGGPSDGAPGDGQPAPPANQAPVVDASVSAADYAENDPAFAPDPGLTVADADSAALTGATVRIDGGYETGKDVLAFANQGGIAGSWNAATGVLTLGGTATPGEYADALSTVTYVNTSEDPTPGARTVEYRATDGEAESAAATVTIEVTAENDAPGLDPTSSGAPLIYTENAATTAIDSTLTLTDLDSATFASAKVAITDGLQPSEDRLELTAPVAGITASYDQPTGTLTLTGPAPRADFEQALRNVGYRNVSEDPETTPRTVEFQAIDADGADTPIRMRDIGVANIEDAPLVTATGTALAYAENSPATALDSGLTVTDADSATLVGATVQLTTGYVSGEDVLAFPGAIGIVGAWDAGTGTLTLTGPASLSAFQDALRSVTYVNTSDDPEAGARAATIEVDDGVETSNQATRSIELSAADDAPTVTLPTAGALEYTEDAAATAIDPALTVSDPDSASLASATVAITDGLQQLEDRLELTAPVAGITASYDQPTGTLTLTGPAPRADFEQALRNVGYRNVSEDPETTPRTVSVSASDSASGPVATRSVAVTATNDTPVAGNDVGATDEVTTLNVAADGVLGNDSDVDGDPLTVVAVQSQAANVGTATPTAKGASVTVNADGSYAYDPSGSATLRALGEGETDADTFTYRAGDGAADATATVTITVTGLPDPPEATDDSYGGVGNTTLAVGETGPPGEPFKQLTGSVLDNDTDPDTPHEELTVEAGTVATTSGGSVTIAADGNFTYTPPAGSTATDSFDYTVTDGERDDTGTVEIPLTGRVWYVDNQQTAGGLGRSGDPFDQLNEAVAASSIGDTLYVFRGDGTTTGMNAGAVLKADQRLLGEAVDLVVGGHTLFAGNPANRPAIGNAAGTGVTLAGATRVAGLNVSAAGTAIRGNGIAGVTIEAVTASGASGVSLQTMTGTTTFGDIAITASNGTGFFASGVAGLSVPSAATATVTATGGPAVDVRSSTTPSVTFDSASSTNSGTAGLNVDSVAGGTVAAVAGSISGAADAAIDVNSGNGAITYGGAVNDGSGRPAEITARTGGTVSVSGTIADDDSGIVVSGNSGGSTTFSGSSKTISSGAVAAVNLSNNTGHSVSFSGGNLALTTTSGAGLAATGGGTVDVQGTGNTIASTTGTALQVQNTTIGASDLTFQRIAANGGANGIVLDNTGASGGLTVTGSGTADSGGVIQNTAGADGTSAGVGAYLNSTRDVSLTRMRFTSHQGHAIRANGVNGFALANSVVNGTNGTNDGNDEGAIALRNLSGTSSIVDTDISGGYEDNVVVESTAGTTNLALTRIDVGANSTNLGGNSLLVQSRGSATMDVDITDSDFTSSREDLVQMLAADTSDANFTFSGNRLSNSHPNKIGGGAGILMTSSGILGSDLTYRIADNTVSGTSGPAIFVQKASGISDARGRIHNNTVGVSGQSLSGSQFGAAIGVEARGQGSHRAAITNNTLRQYRQDGISLVAGEDGEFDNGTVAFDVTATGNALSEPGPQAGAGLRAEVADENSIVTFCLDANTNSLAGTAPIGTDVRVFNDWPQTVFRLPGYGGGAQDATAVQNYFAGRNTLTTRLATVPGSGNGYSSTAACAQPPA